MTDRLFDDEEYEVPLLPVARQRESRGGTGEYPPSWNRCEACVGTGVREQDLMVQTMTPMRVARVTVKHLPTGITAYGEDTTQLRAKLMALSILRAQMRARGDDGCGDCLGMGSLKARVRLEAGHRCVRCKHPYIPTRDAEMLGVKPTFETVEIGGRLVNVSTCDDQCAHGDVVEAQTQDGEWIPVAFDGYDIDERKRAWWTRRAWWRILTVHHLDMDKSNCRWWNLAALCQRCHLEIQAKVVMERVYPHPHSGWFKPYVAGYYAWVYLGETLTRDETMARLRELLALELAPTA